MYKQSLSGAQVKIIEDHIEIAFGPIDKIIIKNSSLNELYTTLKSYSTSILDLPQDVIEIIMGHLSLQVTFGMIEVLTVIRQWLIFQ